VAYRDTGGHESADSIVLGDPGARAGRRSGTTVPDVTGPDTTDIGLGTDIGPGTDIDSGADIDPGTDPADPADDRAGNHSTDPDPATSPDPAANPTSRWPLLVACLAVAAVAAPIVTGILSWVGRDWLPVQDLAVLDLRVRDVGTAQTPLVGPYSRYTWSHPGPALFWALAVPSRLAGTAAWGTLVGAMVLQLVAVVWTGVVGWRAGRLPLTLTLTAVVALSYAATGSWLVLEPWNPHIALPWFVLFVVLAWRLSLGETQHLTGVVLAGSFLVQTHVGYAPLVGVAVAYVIGTALVDRRPRPWRLARWSWITALVVAAGLWLPVLVEQLTNDPGNLTLLERFFLGGGPDRATAGLRTGAGLFSAQFRIPPPWLGGEDPIDPFDGTVVPASLRYLAIPLVLSVAGYVASRAPTRRADHRWVELVFVLGVVGVVALSRITDELTPYLFYWRIPLAVLCVASCGWAVARWTATVVSGSTAHILRVAAGVALGLVVAVPSAALTAAVATHGDTVFSFEHQARQLLDQLEARGPLTEPTIVRFDGTTLGGLHGAIVDAYDRAGAPVKVDEVLDFQFGEARSVPAEQVDTVWMVLEDGRLVSEMTALPGATVIARQDPLGPVKEAELVALQRQVAEQLRAAGRSDLIDRLDAPLVAFTLDGVPGLDDDAVGRLGELNAEREATGRCRCAVIAFPADQAPPLPPQL
jgi:hypothetical protein